MATRLRCSIITATWPAAAATRSGLYHRDTRFLSRLKLTLEQRSPLLLSSTVRTNNAVLDVDLTNPDIQQGETLVLAKDTVHLSRMKFLWNATCYELLVLRNFGAEHCRLRLAFDFDADFADLFEVRGFKRRARGARQRDCSRCVMKFTSCMRRRTTCHAPRSCCSIRLPTSSCHVAPCSSSSCRRESVAPSR